MSSMVRLVILALKVQMTKIYIPVSPLQLERHCFNDYNAEHR